MQYETSMKTNGDVDDLENPASNERNESDADTIIIIRSIVIIFIIITTGSSISPIVNDVHQNLTMCMDDMAANNNLYPITFPNIGSMSAENEVLSCPHQAKVYGYDFALTTQRYRRI
jgi:hypothetical protein